jgi:NAD(P)H-quinone oxidoreductase subunit 5
MALRLGTRVALALALLQTALALYAGVKDGSVVLVILLIAFLGWIIGDYAQRYLEGEPGQRRFRIAYLTTLASVGTVVISQDLVTLLIGWIASSVGMHHLLTYYPQRTAAVVVAHKKFIASRLADLCFGTAVILLWTQYHTVSLQELVDLPQISSPTLQAHIATVLIALAVLLKCAQLPVHGWLIQVMEAPTPVSALLHAGVVNLGGVVLIRLAPLLNGSPVAQWLLVVVGSLTAVLAGLVMLTRVTIKVRLAWSTCSQMGLMILECGLGLYDIALLHLLAHALYKAYAFLTSGDVVRTAILSAPDTSLTTKAGLPPIPSLIMTVTVMSSVAMLWSIASGGIALPTVGLMVISFGLATLWWRMPRTAAGLLRSLLATAGATLAYLALHTLAPLPHPADPVHREPIMVGLAIMAMACLYFTQASLLRRERNVGSRLYEWLYAGLYLDEWFTRLTFRIWPPQLTESIPEDPSLQWPEQEA